MLERYDGKLSRTVPWGGEGREPSALPGTETGPRMGTRRCPRHPEAASTEGRTPPRHRPGIERMSAMWQHGCHSGLTIARNGRWLRSVLASFRPRSPGPRSGDRT